MIARRWKHRWAEEVACDTVAARLLGPAYGWCNLQVCVKEPESARFGSHPANEARTRHINRVIRRGGWHAEADKLETLWQEYSSGNPQQAPLYYHEMHPDELFLAVMEDVDSAVDQMPPPRHDSSDSLVSRINDVWQ
jgi:hypothetical protein